MNEITDNIQKALHSQKNQEPETPENENTQEINDTEQAKDDTAITDTKDKLDKIRGMRVQNKQEEITEEIEVTTQLCLQKKKKGV